MKNKNFLIEASKITAKKFNISNLMAIPKITKIVLNIGFGKDRENQKLIDTLKNDLYLITGQKPNITKSRKSIASFKVRSGENIGIKLTLRDKKMIDFIYKLINLTIPSIRDFRGINNSSFDKQGNYTLGLKEISVFPEITYSKDRFQKGLEVSFITNVSNLEINKTFFQDIGFPFKKEQ